jgi:hypothetical protein
MRDLARPYSIASQHRRRSSPAPVAAAGSAACCAGKLLGLLGIGSNDPTNAELISVGRPATAAQYFLDLRLVVGLLQDSWPQARALAEPWMSTDTVDYHLEQQRQQATTVHQARGMALDVAIYDRPPLAAAACGSLLALADRILTLDDLPAARAHLDPLIAQVVARRISWVEHLRGAEPTALSGCGRRSHPRSRPDGGRTATWCRYVTIASAPSTFPNSSRPAGMTRTFRS